MNKATKSRAQRLIDEINSRPDSPKSFDWARFSEQLAREGGPPGFPEGALAPASIPDSKERRENRERLAAQFAKQDHESLAAMAAALLDGLSLWRVLFKHYATFEEGRRRFSEADLLERVYDI